MLPMNMAGPIMITPIIISGFQVYPSIILSKYRLHTLGGPSLHYVIMVWIILPGMDPNPVSGEVQPTGHFHMVVLEFQLS